jgi:PAS domain S-box-containing protein
MSTDSMTTTSSNEADEPQLYSMQVRQLKDYAIFFVDLNGRIRTWNAGVEHLLGYAEWEWINQHTSVIFTPADEAATLCDSEMNLARERGSVSDIRWHRRKDGTELFANGVLSTVYDAAGTLIGFTKLISDETSRKQLEDSLVESNSALEHFAYAASHDLQEPLRTIGNYADLIRRRHGHELGEDGTRWLGLIEQTVNRMRVLIDDVLTFVQLGVEPETVVPLSLDEDVETAMSQLAQASEESGAEVTHDPLPTITGDHRQLARLFQNLISNAIKYRSSDRPPRIHITARSEGNYWVVSVADNGIGFAQEYGEAIFSPFKRLHGREYSGSGVGLAICRRIVERHGGRIWAASTIDKGSTFHFTLPRVE